MDDGAYLEADEQAEGQRHYHKCHGQKYKQFAACRRLVADFLVRCRKEWARENEKL